MTPVPAQPASQSAPLRVYRDPPLDGPTNMARDEHLLYADGLRGASVRLYAWTPPTISLGYFQRWEQLATLPAEVSDLAVVRRLTGGGAILHDREVTYCLVLYPAMPIALQAPLALYSLVHSCWRDALAADGLQSELAPDSFPMPTPRTGPFFCFQKPGRTDLIVGPDKLLGSAQRRLPDRVLQHGSLLLGRRFAAHPGVDLGLPDVDRVERWCERWVAGLAAALGLTPVPQDWTAEQLADVSARRARYASTAWNQLR